MRRYGSWLDNGKPAITILFCLFVLFACDRELISPIPYAPVYIKLSLSYEDHTLMSPLATKSFTKPRSEADRTGFGGVLVINGGGVNANGEPNLFAYDLACPVEANRSIKVVPDDGEGKATCPVCGAVYHIAFGTGMPESVSQYPLRAYMVTSLGGNRFVVRN